MTSSPAIARGPGLGPIGGILAMILGSVIAAWLDGSASAPLGLAASVIQGPAVLTLHPLPADSVLIGVLVLAVLGAASGQWLLLLCQWFPGLAATPGTLIITGATFYALLWLIGFYLIGGLLRPWLLQTDPIVYAPAAIVAGAGLGALFAVAGVRRPVRLE